MRDPFIMHFGLRKDDGAARNRAVFHFCWRCGWEVDETGLIVQRWGCQPVLSGEDVIALRKNLELVL